jgi:hypothetical protein
VKRAITLHGISKALRIHRAQMGERCGGDVDAGFFEDTLPGAHHPPVDHEGGGKPPLPPGQTCSAWAASSTALRSLQPKTYSLKPGSAKALGVSLGP